MSGEIERLQQLNKEIEVLVDAYVKERHAADVANFNVDDDPYQMAFTFKVADGRAKIIGWQMSVAEIDHEPIKTQVERLQEALGEARDAAVMIKDLLP